MRESMRGGRYFCHHALIVCWNLVEMQSNHEADTELEPHMTNPPASLSPSSSSSTAWWQTLRMSDVALATIIVLVVGLSFALMLSLLNVIVNIFLGLLLATALRPLMNRLRGSVFSVTLSAAISAFFLVLFAIGFLVLVVPLLIAQFQALVLVLPQLYKDIRQGFLQSPFLIVRQLAVPMPAQLSTNSSFDSATLGAQIFGWLPSIGYALFATVGTILFTYYWLLYRDRTIRSLLLLLPEQRRAGVEQTWLQVEERIGAFIRGQLLLGLATGVLSLIGYWAIGLPYPLMLALLAGVLEFIPYVGPFVTMALAGLSGFSISPSLGLSGLVVGIVVQQIESLLLVPRVMEKTVGISPVVSMLAFIGFAALFGPIGGLLAIPLAALLQVLFRGWIERRTTAVPAADAGRGALDLIRYQIANLADDIALTLRQKQDDIDQYSDDTEEELESILANLRVLVDTAEQAQ